MVAGGKKMLISKILALRMRSVTVGRMEEVLQAMEL